MNIQSYLFIRLSKDLVQEGEVKCYLKGDSYALVAQRECMFIFKNIVLT
jgi:hypothetical protein